MPGEKGTTTLYLDRTLVNSAKELGLNMSNICNEALRLTLDRSELYSTELRLADITEQLQAFYAKKRELAEKAAIVEKRITELEATRTEQLAIQKRLDDAANMASILRDISVIARQNNYDVESTRHACEGLLDSLRELGYGLEGDAFAKHITRLRGLQQQL